MNYFIFYKNTCVAYTDSKKMKKAFINQFKNKEAFKVDKFKEVDKFYLEDQQIEDMKLYYNNDAHMFLSDGLEQELYEFGQSLSEAMLIKTNHLDKLCYNMRFDDNEDYILTQFLLNFGFRIEDVEWSIYDTIDFADALENHVFEILNEQFNRKE